MKRALVVALACLSLPAFGQEVTFRAGRVVVTCVDASSETKLVVSCSLPEQQGAYAQWELMQGTRKRLDSAEGWRYEVELGARASATDQTLSLWLFVWERGAARSLGQLHVELCWNGEYLFLKSGERLLARSGPIRSR